MPGCVHCNVAANLLKTTIICNHKVNQEGKVLCQHSACCREATQYVPLHGPDSKGYCDEHGDDRWAEAHELSVPQRLLNHIRSQR